MIERWKPIKGYEGRYRVSNLGNVCYLSGTTWHYKSQSSASSKYKKVVLFRDGKRHTLWVHRLVAEAFVKNREGKPQIDHINGIAEDNRSCNLRWSTAKENSNNPITLLRRKIARTSGMTYAETLQYVIPRVYPRVPSPIVASLPSRIPRSYRGNGANCSVRKNRPPISGDTKSNLPYFP